MMKVRIAIGFGLVLFMATMIGGPVRVSQAQDDEGVTLASLAGKFSLRGGGFVTFCVNATFTAPAACASVPQAQRVLFNLATIGHFARDAVGNACLVFTGTTRRALVGASAATSASTSFSVATNISFDPTTGSGTASFSNYNGGSCIGAAFDSTGATLTATGTVTYDVSDSGDRIEYIVAGLTAVDGSTNGLVLTYTAIRQ
jgi:hypothetical protein